jgi:prephenate dehydratase
MNRPVVYPGPEGAHSAAAAEALFPAAGRVPLPTFRAVADSVAAAEASYGILPIESSLIGAIAETHDLVYDTPLSIVGETVIAVQHALLALGPTPVEELRTIRSHPAALEQCRSFLARIPHIQLVATPTTSDAAREVAEKGDPTEAAIASPKAAELYELEVVDDHVGDDEAFTRFVSLATHTLVEPAEGRTFRTALSFLTDHRPGALHRAIEPFASSAIDMVQLVSRPLPKSHWRYRFDVVIAGHLRDPAVHEALAEVSRRSRQLRVLGCYEADERRP